MVPAYRNAGRVDLREARVGKPRTPLVRAEGRAHIATHRIGRQVKHRPIAAGGQHHHICGVPFQLASLQITRDDATRFAVNNHQVLKHAARMHPHPARMYLPAQGLVCSQGELLPRLPPAIKGARHLRAAKAAVVQLSAIFTGKWHTLSHALVNDVATHLGQPMHIRLAGPEIASLDSVVKQPPHAVAIVLIILGCINPTLRSNRVRPSWRVLVTKTVHIVAQLGQAGRSRSTGKAGTHNQNAELPLVGRVHQLHVCLEARPLLSKWPRGDMGIYSRFDRRAIGGAIRRMGSRWLSGRFHGHDCTPCSNSPWFKMVHLFFGLSGPRLHIHNAQ